MTLITIYSLFFSYKKSDTLYLSLKNFCVYLQVDNREVFSFSETVFHVHHWTDNKWKEADKLLVASCCLNCFALHSVLIKYINVSKLLRSFMPGELALR